MLTFEKVLAAFKDYLEKDDRYTILMTPRGYTIMEWDASQQNWAGAEICATPERMRDLSTLWSQPRPIILTSGTLAVGSDFRRFREEAGLLEDSRVTESVSLSPFDYRENCLLYVPQFPPGQRNEAYYDKLTDEIALLLDAAHGHALVLFTSYAAMSAVKERLTAKDLLWPLFTLGRNAGHTTEQFKASPGSVCWPPGRLGGIRLPPETAYPCW